MFKRVIFILCAILIVAQVAGADTYRNDTGQRIQVKNDSGRMVPIAVGETFTSLYPVNIGGVTKISDAPYYNPIISRTAVQSSGIGDDQTATLTSPGYIFIWKVVGGPISVFYDSTDNTPPVAILRPGDYFQQDPKGRVDQLVLQFSSGGSCEVLETNEVLK